MVLCANGLLNSLGVQKHFLFSSSLDLHCSVSPFGTSLVSISCSYKAAAHFLKLLQGYLNKVSP